MASSAVGKSVSSPSTPRDLWCVRWYGYYNISHQHNSSHASLTPQKRSGRKPYTKATYPERSTIRHPNWKIGKYSHCSILPRLSESQVVTDFMNRQEQILVRCSSHHICCSPESPSPEARIPQTICSEDLNANHKQDCPFRERFGSA